MLDWFRYHWFNIVIGLIVIVFIFGLSMIVVKANSGEYGGPNEVGEDLRVENIHLPDGRTVQCVIYQDINEGGIDCDWDSAR